MSVVIQNTSFGSSNFPLAGVGQWAGTTTSSPGQATQVGTAAPLNAIRANAGKFWTAAEENVQTTFGTARPMSTFGGSLNCIQGQAQAYSTSAITGRDQWNIQGQFANGFTMNGPVNPISMYTGPGTVIYGPTGTASGGNGAQGQNSGSGFVGQPGGNSTAGTAFVLNGTSPGYQSVVYNHGTIYGSGGGGAGCPAARIQSSGPFPLLPNMAGSGGGGQPAGTAGTPGGTPPSKIQQNCTPGQSVAPFAGGANIQYSDPAPGQSSPVVGFYNNSAGGVGQWGQAGQGTSAVVTVFQNPLGGTFDATLASQGASGGAAATSLAGTNVKYGYKGNAN
jgi:hypothetical protein